MEAGTFGTIYVKVKLQALQKGKRKKVSCKYVCLRVVMLRYNCTLPSLFIVINNIYRKVIFISLSPDTNLFMSERNWKEIKRFLAGKEGTFFSLLF